MKNILLRSICLLPICVLAGCASSYRSYTCGEVSCSYCPPNPLPYTTYQSCNCNDSIGGAYLANPMAASTETLTPANRTGSYYSVPKVEGHDNADLPINNGELPVEDQSAK